MKKRSNRITKALRIGGYTAGGALMLAGAAVAYLFVRQPAAAEPAPIRVEPSAARIARGRYIYNLSDCDGCHSQRDFTRFSGPVIEAGRGRGFIFPDELGLPGRVVAPNITPEPETGIGAWTDGEKVRAIRDGIGRDGRALFPMMGYQRYRHMSDEDVYSLVAYLNTLKPLKSSVPRTELKFPVGLLIKGAPKPAGSVPPPDRTSKLKYGEYLATLAGCAECHTAQDGGEPLAGGQVFRFPGMAVASPNITPDLETGIGRWSEEYFLERFYQYQEYCEKGAPKASAEAFTLMPWLNFAQLPAEDLKAIYAWLMAQPAVRNPVDTHAAQSTAQAGL
jgi:mono/diheme cytochrome c family protein